MTYLERLTLRLAEGLGTLPEAHLEPHADYLVEAQRPDGGFSGREGESDLYYTGFALRGLALTGRLHGSVAQRAADFLGSKLGSQAPIVDFLSLVYGGTLLSLSAGIDVFVACQSDWQDNVVEMLEQYRREDGGYAKTSAGARSSTYHSFLTLLCFELLDRAPPAPHRIADFIRSQQRDDGGYVEMAPMKRSGTNPTAAAIGALDVLDALSDDVRQQTGGFLSTMQTDEGGLRANTRIPIADILSSFTGLLTLQDLGAADTVDAEHLKTYTDSLADPEGGFHGAAWDAGKDVEYTFYGLGTLALLAGE